MTIAIESTDWQSAPARTTKPLVAVGDIHGASSLLSALRSHLDAQAPHRRIYLGDFVDPYPKYVPNHDVPSVLDQLAEDLDRDAVALAGNHELMMRCWLEFDGKNMPQMQAQHWLIDNDGNATLSSFGVAARDRFEDRMAALRSRMTAKHYRVFESLKTHFEIGKYICIHAGFLGGNGYSWGKQIAAEDWFTVPVPNRFGGGPHPMWNRLLGDEGPRGRVQINGHTPMREPFVGKRRIAIDTGAKVGGPLTAVEIVADKLRFHHACPVGVTMASWARRE